MIRSNNYKKWVRSFFILSYFLKPAFFKPTNWSFKNGDGTKKAKILYTFNLVTEIRQHSEDEKKVDQKNCIVCHCQCFFKNNSWKKKVKLSNNNDCVF